MISFYEWMKLQEYASQGVSDDIPLTVQNNISIRKNRHDSIKPEIRSKYEAFMKKKMKKDN